MALNKKIPRTILEHKSQYFGAAILVALSCMLFAVFNIMGENVLNNLAAFKSDDVQEDASMILSSDLADLPSLESKYNMLIEKRGSADCAYGTDTTLRILSATKKVDRYAVIKGSGLSGDTDILVDPAFAEAHNIAVGSSIHIFGQDFTVKGTASTPDYIYPLKNEDDMMKNPDAFGVAIISEKAFENLNQGYWFYSVKFNGSNGDDFKNSLSAGGSLVKWVSKEDNMRISFINGDVKGIKPMGTVLPLAVLILTCVMVSVVLWRLLRQEFTQIGVFCAIGYRKGEIIRHYLAYPLLISAAGGIIGTALGALCVRPFVEYVSTFYNLPVLKLDYIPFYLAAGVLLPFLFLVPTGLAVIVKALRMSPLQLIRGGVEKSKINFLERSLRLERFRFGTKFKIREIIRNIPRTVLLFLGVVCASSLLLLGFSTKDSMNSLMGTSFENTYRYQYIYSFNALQTDQPESGEKVSLSSFTAQSGGKQISTVIYGIQPDAGLIHLTDAKGNQLNYNQVIITRALADRFSLQPGDSIAVQDKVSGKKATLQVDSIADYYMGDFIYMPIDRFNSMFGYPQGSYLQLYSDKKLDIPSTELVSTTDRQYMISSYNTIIQPLRVMAGGIGVTSFLIGLIILYVVTSLLIEENRETVSLLKVLGYDRKSLYSLLLNPYTGFVLLGYLVSVPLVLYSLGLFFYTMTAEMNMSIPARLNPVDMLLGLIIILATYELTKLLNRRKITGISMSDTLKNKWE